MTFSDLTARMEERLSFYAQVLDRLGEAALEGDVEKLRLYAALEKETSTGIAAVARCYHARIGEKTASENCLTPGERSEDRSDPLEGRIRAAATRAAKSSRRARARLSQGKVETLRLLQENRRKRRSPRFAPSLTAPELLDLQL